MEKLSLLQSLCTSLPNMVCDLSKQFGEQPEQSHMPCWPAAEPRRASFSDSDAFAASKQGKKRKSCCHLHHKLFMWPWLWRLVLRGFCVFIRLVICGASFLFFFLHEAVWSWVIRSSKGSYDYLQSCMTKRSHRLFSANAIMHRSHFCFYWSLLTVTRLHLGPFSLSAQSEAFCVHTVLSFLVGEVCPYMRESEARL